MTTERVYDIKVNGADSMNELKTAVSELTEKLKTLDSTSKEYLETLKQLTEYQQKLSDAMNGISDAAQKTDTSLNGIKETVGSVADSISNLGEDVINSFAEGLAQGMAEAASETNQMGESMENSVNSVKGLKQEISDLRDKLVNLDKGTDEYKSTVSQLIDDQVKLKEVMNAGKNETQAAEGSYNNLTQRMSALKQVWKETTDEATRNEIGAQIAELNAQLKGMDASIGNFQRNVGNYKSALDGLDGSFVNWKQELKECKEALQQLDPSTQEYADTMARASELTHLMAQQQEQIKYSSTDLGDQLNNVRGIASNLAAGYSALNAAMGLFGEENEDVQQAMLKVQQAMALVQGLQGIDGFIKRTKGLSQSMGLVTKATEKNTVVTKANAAAAKQDAAAKTAEAAATQAAVPAQKALNVAMEANPIGLILGLISALVAAFILFKDKITDLIGGSEELTNSFNKAMAILSGFGNVIKNSVIKPIELAITPMKTLIKMIGDLSKGNFKDIGKDVKEGLNDMADAAKDAFNVVGNFNEGYNRKIQQQNETARKKEAEARSKELDNIIKDNNAKYGSDYKYTEEAKKLYDEYFELQLSLYKKDSDEYREALRDKWAYDREFSEKQQEEQDKKNAEQEKKNKEAAKKEEELRKKQLNDFKSSFEKYMPNWDKFQIDISNMFDKWISGVNEFRKELQKAFESAGDSAQEALEKTDAVVTSIYIEWQKTIWNDMYGKEWNANLERLFYNLDKTTQTYLKKTNQLFQEEKIKFGIEFPTDELSNFYAIYKTTKKNIEKEQDELEKTLNKFYTGALKDANILQGLLNKESDALGEHLVENIKYYIGVYNMAIEAAASGNTELSAAYTKAFEDNMTAIINADWNKEALEKALGEYLSEFQKMLDKRNQLSADYATNDLEYFTKSADIYEKVYEQKLQKYSNQIELMSKQRESLFDQEFNNAMRWQGVYDNAIRDLYEQDSYAEESYNLQIGYYNNLLEHYNKMTEDMTLTFEQREEAKREAAKITNDIMIAYWDEETRKIKLQKDLIKGWSDAVKDAASGVGDILGTIGDSWSSIIELEKTEIAQQLENGEITQEEAKKREQANKESFENLKKIQIAEAIINALASAVGAYQSMASIPYVGPVLGAVAAAAALASGYAQVRQIQATNYESSSIGGGSSSSTNFQLPNVMELEPTMNPNTTNQNNIDELDNNGRGGRDTAIKAFVVESDVTASQELAMKRSSEITF